MEGVALFPALVEPSVSNVDLALRLGAALLLGGVVGFERELMHQPAGLRTHITVALGAALFGIISVHGFDAYAQPRADANYNIDVTRVASQVVVAIGFLGGGTILKHGASVRGLTTAASLWVTCAIGLAAGLGSFMAAALTTVAVMVSLVGLRKPRDLVRRKLARERASAIISLRRDADANETIRALLDLDDVTVHSVSIHDDGGDLRIEAGLTGAVGVDLASALADIAAREDVADVDLT